jgi:hypothetical protein
VTNSILSQGTRSLQRHRAPLRLSNCKLCPWKRAAPSDHDQYPSLVTGPKKCHPMNGKLIGRFHCNHTVDVSELGPGSGSCQGPCFCFLLNRPPPERLDESVNSCSTQHPSHNWDEANALATQQADTVLTRGGYALGGELLTYLSASAAGRAWGAPWRSRGR